MKKPNNPIGWYVFIVECSDSSYYSGMCRCSELENKIQTINTGRIPYFKKFKEKTPVKIVFIEDIKNFSEAVIKNLYLKEMNKKLRKRLVETKRWPLGKKLTAFLESKKT